MTRVFLLWHSRDKSDDNTDDKLVGVYSSREAAEAAIQRKLTFPSFRDHPDGFVVDSYTIDRDAWSEGFVADHDSE
jgi:hypothetical protein